MNSPKKLVGCCCCVTALVTVAVFVFMCFSSLSAQEYGLDYSSITKTVDTMLYSSGYHYLGFGHKFIIFPSTS
jgi:hypothetical protein